MIYLILLGDYNRDNNVPEKQIKLKSIFWTDFSYTNLNENNISYPELHAQTTEKGKYNTTVDLILTDTG